VREERWKTFIEWSDLKKTVPSVVLKFLTSQVPNEFPDGWREVLRKRIQTRYEGFYERVFSPLIAEVSNSLIFNQF
jgi:hypothetical protein